MYVPTIRYNIFSQKFLKSKQYCQCDTSIEYWNGLWTERHGTSVKLMMQAGRGKARRAPLDCNKAVSSLFRAKARLTFLSLPPPHSASSNTSNSFRSFIVGQAKHEALFSCRPSPSS